MKKIATEHIEISIDYLVSERFDLLLVVDTPIVAYYQYSATRTIIQL